MNKTIADLDSFERPSREEWIARISQSLKGRDLSELKISLDHDWQFDPIIFPGDKTTTSVAYHRSRGTGPAGIKISCKSDEVRTLTLGALEQGVENILFSDAQVLSPNELRETFLGVEFSYFDAFFEINAQDSIRQAFIESLQSISNQNWSKKCYLTTQEQSASVSILPDAINKVADLMRKAFLIEKPVLKLALSENYFMNIAFGRAMGICLRQMSVESGKDTGAYLVHVHLPDQNPNMGQGLIEATTMISSAILGGYPAVFLNGDSMESNRLYINIFHILKEEAGFLQVEDPCAGSRHIEAMTQEFAEKIWETFIEKLDQQ